MDSRDFGRDPMQALRWQHELETRAWRLAGGSFRAPMQSAGRFLHGCKGYELGRVEPSYSLGICEGDFDCLFPNGIAERLRDGLRCFGRRIPGFDAPDALLTAPETRTSSPIRILREEGFTSPAVDGLYPAGEGAGYAGGIMSAAVDGIKAAEAIIKNWKPAG